MYAPPALEQQQQPSDEVQKAILEAMLQKQIAQAQQQAAANQGGGGGGMNPMSMAKMLATQKGPLAGGDTTGMRPSPFGAGTDGYTPMFGDTSSMPLTGGDSPVTSMMLSPSSSGTGGAGGSGGGSLGGGMAGMAPVALPLAAAAVASGVALNEGNSPKTVFGREGWGGQPMEVADRLKNGDMRGGLAATGGPAALLGEGPTKDKIAKMFGTPGRLFSWAGNKGDTMDLIRAFSNPV